MGSRTERLLLEDAQEFGWVGLKVDIGSGAGYHQGHDAGDIILGRPHPGAGPWLEDNAPTASELYVIEEKYRSSDSKIYLQPQQKKTDAMIEFAEGIGATPLLAARWSTNLDGVPDDIEATHYIRDIREVERTPAGNINLKPRTAIDTFQTTDEFFSEVRING